jgi:hypothetical protein
MSWLILLLITLTIITRNSCDQSNINLKDKQESCSTKGDGDSLCENEVRK